MFESFVNAVDAAILDVVGGAIFWGVGRSGRERVNSRRIVVVGDIFYSVVNIELMSVVHVPLHYDLVLGAGIEPDFRVFQVLQRRYHLGRLECLCIFFQHIQFNFIWMVHAIVEPIFIGAAKGSTSHDSNPFEKVRVNHMHLVSLEASAAEARDGGRDALQGRQLDWLAIKHRER